MGVYFDHLFNFVLVLLVELTKSIVAFLQLFDDVGLLLDLLEITLFFFLKVVVGVIQNLYHFFDLQLIPFHFKKRFVHMLLLPLE